MGWWHHGWGIGGWEGILVGGLMMLLFWGGLFALLFFAIRLATGNRQGGSKEAPGDRALQILAERYAKGEIDSDTYREMKAELEK